MYVDKLFEFGDGVTAVGTSGAITPMVGSVDKGAALNDLGAGEELFVVFQVDTAVISAGYGASVTFQVIDDDNATLSSGAVLVESGAIAEALLVAGYQWSCRLPSTTQRYIGAAIKPSGENTTGGTISAFLTKDVPKNTNYPTGFTVL